MQSGQSKPEKSSELSTTFIPSPQNTKAPLWTEEKLEYWAEGEVATSWSDRKNKLLKIRKRAEVASYPDEILWSCSDS